MQTSLPQPIWQPTIPSDQIPMNLYRVHINRKFNQNLNTSHDLHKWSVTHPQDFWIDLHDYIGIVPKLPPGTHAYNAQLPMSAIPRFFEGAVVNYAENVFSGKPLDRTALVGIREKDEHFGGDLWTWGRLAEVVRQARSALLQSGICEGDRVGAVISTSVWSVALFLATASIGAIWTSIAPDIGEEGCVSRFQQIAPKLIFADNASTFKGKTRSSLTKIQNIANRLERRPQVFMIPLSEIKENDPVSTLDTFLSRSLPDEPLQFTRVPYSHPLYILYTSGTTGQPKCLVHSHSVIVQHKKVSLLHNSLLPDDVVFQYSSTSWVLWNIMVGHLSVGPTLVLYDGSPLWPKPQVLLKILELHRVTYWGVSPRYLQELEMTGCVPKDEVDLSSLKMVQAGGSHLATNQYHWFYRAFPQKVHLTSVTGGTDLVTSWVGTDPAGPLYPGEMQLPMLGQDVDIADPATGESVKDTGRHGEFVCRKPFPSMPVFFWGDSDDRSKYIEAYFVKFPNCWAQHDWASCNPITRGWQVHGRSDGVLNPQGIRFGSSDIYSIVEAAPFNRVLSNTLCVGRRRPGLDTDESVFLFVVMQSPHKMTDGLVQNLKDAIQKGLSKKHVPRFIIQVPEIPVTVNGKKIETLVKGIICTGGLPKAVSNTVANPGCLASFQQFYELEIERRSKL